MDIDNKNSFVPTRKSSPKPRAKRKKKLINISVPVMLNSFLVEPTHNSCDTGRSDLLLSNQKSKCNTVKCIDSASGKNKQGASKSRKRKVESGCTSPELHSSKNKKMRVVSNSSMDGNKTSPMQNAQPAVHRRRSARLSGVNVNRKKSSLSDQTNTPSTANQSQYSFFNSSAVSTIGDASMSVFYGDTTFALVAGLPPPRLSIDEFSVLKSRKGRKHKPASSMASVTENDTSEKENEKNVSSNLVGEKSLQKECMESSSSSDQSGSKCGPKDTRCKTNSVQLRRANSFVMEKSPDGPRTRPSLVMTRLHSE